MASSTGWGEGESGYTDTRSAGASEWARVREARERRSRERKEEDERVRRRAEGAGGPRNGQ